MGSHGFSAPLPWGSLTVVAAEMPQPANVSLQDKLRISVQNLPSHEDMVTLTSGQPHFQSLFSSPIGLPVHLSPLPFALLLLTISLFLGSVPLLPSHSFLYVSVTVFDSCFYGRIHKARVLQCICPLGCPAR